MRQLNITLRSGTRQNNLHLSPEQRHRILTEQKYPTTFMRTNLVRALEKTSPCITVMWIIPPQACCIILIP